MNFCVPPVDRKRTPSSFSFFSNSSSPSLWNTEINVVSWNGAAPKIDIRPWDPEHKKCGKGITLTGDETKKLREILNGNNDALYDKDGKIIF